MSNSLNNEFQVLLTRRMPAASNGEAACWRATVLGLPEVVAEACSREQALAGIEQHLTQLLRQSEIVTINASAVAHNGESQLVAQGWDDYGFFADNPAALELFDEIEVERGQHLIEPSQV